MRPLPLCAAGLQLSASGAAALVTARHSANASSVTFTADVGIRKLKSDLFLQAIITSFLKGEEGCKLVTYFRYSRVGVKSEIR